MQMYRNVAKATPKERQMDAIRCNAILFFVRARRWPYENSKIVWNQINSDLPFLHIAIKNFKQSTLSYALTQVNYGQVLGNALPAFGVPKLYLAEL